MMDSCRNQYQSSSSVYFLNLYFHHYCCHSDNPHNLCIAGRPSSPSHQSDVTHVNHSLRLASAVLQPSREHTSCMSPSPLCVHTHGVHTVCLVYTSQALRAWCSGAVCLFCSLAAVFSDAWDGVTDLGLS